MAVQAALPLVLADVLCCAGLGFLTAAAYDGGRFLLGSSRPVCFVLDLSGFFLAAVLMCSFAAGRSFSGGVRWYMAAGMALGAAGYFRVLAPRVSALQALLRWMLTRPPVLFWLLLVCPARRILFRTMQHMKQSVLLKRKEYRKKQQEKQLQKQCKILYNSN